MYFETEILELKKILEKIANKARLNRSKKLILDIKPINDFDLINKYLEETDEIRRYIAKFGELPFGVEDDILPFINLAKKGGTLKEDEILKINSFIKTSILIKKQKTNLSNQFNFIYTSNYFDSITDLNKLSLEINRVMDESGFIHDNASMDLTKIRREIRLLEGKLKNKLTEMLASKKEMLIDTNIVIRNDRLCLGVKAEYKNTLKGIIHDQSASGQTFYIEPTVTYEINNELLNQQILERAEINKILKMLTGAIASYDIDLENNINSITYIDILSAKALYGFNDIKPELNKKGVIELNTAIHPLLDKAKAVPLNIKFGDKHQTIIITGPNTGGKTVTLKTVGLLTLMTQSGILIPAKYANIAIFDDVFSDIGDEQSIEQSLSTFSSHMKKIVDIVSNLSNNSLVLLDEIGGGTDPVEGSALAISLLDYFMENNARIIITTHYPTLKAYGYENDKILNASMEFNEQTYMPTYKLLLGISGKSNAFLISRHLGLNEAIIDNASNYLYENNSNDSILMKKIEEEGLYLNNLIKENEELKNKLKNKEDEIDFKLHEIELKKESIIKKAKDQANDIYAEAKDKASNLMKEVEELLSESTNLHNVAVVKGKINSLQGETEVNLNERELKVGDCVEILKYKSIGEIIKIEKDKYTVRSGILELKLKISEIKYSYTKPKENKPKPKQSNNQISLKRAISTKLDLRGMRYEDAYIALDKYIDDCVLCKLPSCTIVHGFGTGVIRKMVHDYLKNSKYIESYRFGGEGEGLNGATVAYFK